MKFTFYIDEKRPQTNLIWAATHEDITLEKIQIEAEDMTEAIEKLNQQIYGG